MPKLPTLRLPPARLITVGLLLVCALGAAAAAASHRHVMDVMARTVVLREQIEDAQRLATLVAESEAAKRLWILAGRQEDRDAMVRATAALSETGRELAGRLEAPLLERGLAPVGALLEHVLRLRDQVQAANEASGPSGAVDVATGGGMSRAKATLRARLAEMAGAHRTELALLNERLVRGQVIGFATIGASSLAMLAMLLGALRLLARRRRTAEEANAEMVSRGHQVATLFRMGELLQSSLSPEDIRRVVSHTAEELLPELSGAFYVFNNSRDRIDVLGLWGGRGLPQGLPEHFTPSDCWALKRGRPHGRGVGDGLRCDHAGDEAACTLCVPMQARGEVYGVLQFFDGAAAPLPRARVELAQALADGVSLALANLALREKLRNQALRDELTGLYNRRFLEETLPRMTAHSERRGASIAVLMLDLDHFKQVNDRYGHTTGDAVLREVGAMLLARLRRMDVGCRYGGEELMILMPDCSAVDAMLRAQEICAMVRGMRDRTDSTLPPVTVSIGVAAWPEHGEQIGKVIEAADAALYAAKRAGRDRAMPAEATAGALVAPG